MRSGEEGDLINSVKKINSSTSEPRKSLNYEKELYLFQSISLAKFYFSPTFFGCSSNEERKKLISC